MVTQTSYRAAVGRMLDQFFSSTSTSGGSSSLVDTAAPVMSSISQDHKWRDWWLFRPAAAAAGDKIRVVTTYTPSTGTFTVDKSYTNNPSTEAYELHAMIEPLTEMNVLINAALKKTFLVKEFTLSPASGTAWRHSLASAAAWLTNQKWILRVGYLSSGETRADTDPYERGLSHESYKDGNVVYLYIPAVSFLTTDTLYVQATKPGYDDCMASGGSFGDRSGLRVGTESDEAPINEEWVAWGAINELWERKFHTMAEMYGPQAEKKRVEAAARFSSLTNEYFTANLPRRRDWGRKLTWGRGTGGGRSRW